MENVTKLSDLEAVPIERLTSCFDELGWIYGYSTFPDRGIIWGFPFMKMSLWSGESGVGKSRLAIEAAKRLSRMLTKNSHEGKILYFQTESPLEDFASWVNDTSEYSNIYCSGESSIDKIIDIIYQVKPYVVFIDSVNEIDEFENGNKKEARRLIKGEDDKPGLKQAIQDNRIAHTFILGQLNQDGKTIKGGTSLPHLVDVALDIRSCDEGDDIFTVSVGAKNRHGTKAGHTKMQHTKEGVIEIGKNRFNDDHWCKCFNYETATARDARLASAETARLSQIAAQRLANSQAYENQRLAKIAQEEADMQWVLANVEKMKKTSIKWKMYQLNRWCSKFFNG